MIYSYRRVSTEEQHNGPQAQADAIERWIACNRHTAKPVDFFDNGVSGSVPLADRPEGMRLIVALHAEDTILVSKLDRLFRSVADAALTINAWLKRNIKLVSIGEGFDMTNPYGLAMCQMVTVFAELERSMIRERTKAALQAKKARGEMVGAVPYGWDRDGRRLVTNKEQQRVRKMITAYRDGGFSTREIANALNERGIPAKRGGKWSHSTIATILPSCDS